MNPKRKKKRTDFKSQTNETLSTPLFKKTPSATKPEEKRVNDNYFSYAMQK